MKAAGYSEDEIKAAFRKKQEMTVFTYHGDIDTLMSPLDSIRYYKSFLRSGFMSMDPKTGAVKAYVGGLDYTHFMYDMVSLGRRQVAFGVVLLFIALIMFIVYFFMDKKLDAQTGEAEEKDDPFKISDLGTILSSGGFWVVALLCVLYYSAIFPFQKYAVNMLQCNLVFTEVPADSFWASNAVVIIQYCIMLVVAAAAFASNFSKKTNMKYGLLVVASVALVVFCYMGYMRQSAETVFAVFPLLAVGITPILGNYVDHKGKAASMLVMGSVLLILCHLTFAFVLPAFKDTAVGGIFIAYLTILVLGASFSLVPASLWPSVPKLVDAKIIGSAYALIFWRSEEHTSELQSRI